MVTRRTVQDARLEAGGSHIVRPAGAPCTEGPVNRAVGFVPDGSTESNVRNLAHHVADCRGTKARMLLGNYGGAGEFNAGQSLRRHFADGRALRVLRRPSPPVIMSNAGSPELPRANHLGQVAHFKPFIDRMGVALHS